MFRENRARLNRIGGKKTVGKGTVANTLHVNESVANVFVVDGSVANVFVVHESVANKSIVNESVRKLGEWKCELLSMIYFRRRLNVFRKREFIPDWQYKEYC